MSGPTLRLSEEIHAMKYRQEGESFAAAMDRVARGLGDDTRHTDKFGEIIHDMRFMPAGRVQSAIGASKRVTPYNCFVSGAVMDSFVSGEGNIMQRAAEAAATMRMGGGIGYGFSRLRPRGALIKGLNSQASGPLSFMDIFDAVCKCIASSGHRRGAQMGVLRVDHPDIEEFIEAKQNGTRLTGFNLSIGITDEFMRAVESGDSFDLRFEGVIHRTIDAQELWEKIMLATWDWAEPGVLFLDTINRMNNLYYCEEIEATNPCGEQPLPAHGACLLGSFNLTRYIRSGYRKDWEFNWDQFSTDIFPVVRAMDNVVDRAIYPLPEQKQEAHNKRRMGLGVTGLANAGEALGFPYGSAPFIKFEHEVQTMLLNRSYAASAALAAEKGCFPLYDADRFMAGEFVKTLDPATRQLMKRWGMRNSHLTSIAPTGTISLAADNVSSGIEPVFSYGYDRTIQTFDGPQVEKVEDYGVRKFGVRGVTSDRVTAQQHVDVLVTAALTVDSAVSKTCNVSPDMPWAQFKDIYMSAWQRGAKGCTTFNSGGKRFGVLVSTDAKSNQSPQEREDPELDDLSAATCEIDFATGRRSCE